MTIIVTGGAGFIGSNFVFHMLDKYPDYPFREGEYYRQGGCLQAV